jgi:hypothetical protein
LTCDLRAAKISFAKHEFPISLNSQLTQSAIPQVCAFLSPEMGILSVMGIFHQLRSLRPFDTDYQRELALCAVPVSVAVCQAKLHSEQGFKEGIVA